MLCYHYISLTFLTILLLGVLYEKRRDRWRWRRRHRVSDILGDKLGRKKQAKVTLVDRNATHLWKPLLHEIATGVMDDGTDSLSYRAHGKNHHSALSKVRSRASIVNRNMLNLPLFMGKKAICSWLRVVFLMIT